MKKIIPRGDLFKDPPCMGIKLSPCGDKLVFVGIDHLGNQNLFGCATYNPIPKVQITYFRDPGIERAYWSFDETKILFLKDCNGAGLRGIYIMDLENNTVVNHTKEFPSVNAKIYRVSLEDNRAIVGLNHRNPLFHDLYTFDLQTGEFTLLYENDRFVQFLIDETLQIGVKAALSEKGELLVYTKEDKKILSFSAEEEFHVELLRCHNNILYFLDTRTSDTTELKKLPLNKPRKIATLAHNSDSDIHEVLFIQGVPVAYATYTLYKKWHAIDPKIEKELSFIAKKTTPEFQIFSQSKDDTSWIIKSSLPTKGVQWLTYNRSSGKIKSLFKYPGKRNLSNMYPFSCSSRDGKELTCYLTLPKEEDQEGNVNKPLPLVLIPHGGPFKVRNTFCYDPYHQWLASRGYAVLSVNFRLSAGFGKEFANAGNGQWGKKAQDDLTDAIEYCIKQGITERGKLAIFGGSYGGYAALSALISTPNLFSCAVAICAPSSLKTVLTNVPLYWEFPHSTLSDRNIFFTKSEFIKSMGKNEKHREECSPLNHLEKIEKPLILIHGENDPIVSHKESKQIFTAMTKRNLPVTYISFPDEGHHIHKYPNKMVYLEKSEAFLSHFLGGEHSPISKKIEKQSSAILSKSNQI